MWISLLTVLAIAVASNLDNAGVGIAYGTRSISISWGANAVISLISGLATYAAGLTGDTLTHYFSARAAAWTGGGVMLLVGLWVLSEPWRQRWLRRQRTARAPGAVDVFWRILQNPEEADFDRSQTISMTEALVLGVALAINALAGGFDAGVVHIGVEVTALAVAVFSYVMLAASVYVGRRYAARALGDKATYVAGALLMLIGIHQIW